LPFRSTAVYVNTYDPTERGVVSGWPNGGQTPDGTEVHVPAQLLAMPKLSVAYTPRDGHAGSALGLLPVVYVALAGQLTKAGA